MYLSNSERVGKQAVLCLRLLLLFALETAFCLSGHSCFYVLHRSVSCVIICRKFFMPGTFFITFSECWIMNFRCRIEVDDRTEAYLRVLQQKVTSDTQIVSS